MFPTPPVILAPMDLPDDAPAQPVLTVSELNRMVRRALESHLPLLRVEGEVSNFTRAASGHWYFSLKDAQAQVRCVMFRGRNQFADFTPANGDHVEIRALPSFYEARGEFQLGAESMRRAGAGRLYEAFLERKAKLAVEGLFDPARKRVPPRFPRVIGVVTSPGAAALRDVLTALARRMPGIRVILYPTQVQGAGAGAQIATAIRAAGLRAECEVLLVCRGGGSIEDLWAFNDEAVVRAIAASPMPVVSGVGHETDFTLADFAADLRAPTPTAAAELASPLRDELRTGLTLLERQLHRTFARKQYDATQRLDDLARRLLHPAEHLRRQRAQLDLLHTRLRQRIRQGHLYAHSRLDWLEHRHSGSAQLLRRKRQALDELGARLQRGRTVEWARHAFTLDRLAASLGHLDPAQVLARGYSLVRLAGGGVVQDAGCLSAGANLEIRFHRGGARATVVSTTNE